MAMKTCPECGAKIAGSANPCPHCGKRFTSQFTGIMAIVFAAIVLGMILQTCGWMPD